MNVSIRLFAMKVQLNGNEDFQVEKSRRVEIVVRIEFFCEEKERKRESGRKKEERWRGLKLVECNFVIKRERSRSGLSKGEKERNERKKEREEDSISRVTKKTW